MAEYFVHGVLGNDANPGTIDLPKKTIPHAQTGKNWTPAVVSGDIVNIMVGVTYDIGSASTDRIAPITGVTYRGYGYDLASILEFDQPVMFDPARTYKRRVGSGLWKLNGFSCGATFQAMLLGTSGRTNVTIEDMWIDGAGAGAISQVDIGSAATASGGLTIRRSRFSNAPKVAIQNIVSAASATAAALLMEDCLIEKAGEDLLKFNSQSPNFMLGKHTFLRVALVSPNWNSTLGSERPLSETYQTIPGGNGDCIQVQATSGRFDGATLFDGLYARKEGGGKQFMVMHDAVNGWTVRNFHIDGGGTKMVAIGPLRGKVLFENGFFDETSVKTEATLFRCNPIDPTDGTGANAPITNTALDTLYGHSGTPGVNAVYNVWLGTAQVRIRNVMAAGSTGAMFLTLWEPQSTGPNYRIGCPVIVENCTSLPMNVSSWTTGTIGGALTGGFDVQGVGGQIACWASRMVFDGDTAANAFSLTVRNNAFLKTGIAAIRQPNSTLNDTRFKYRNNAFGTTPALWIQNVTAYTGIAALQAAHNQALNNLEGATVNEDGTLPVGSALLTSGFDSGWVRDIQGKQGRKFIGAYGPARLRKPL